VVIRQSEIFCSSPTPFRAASCSILHCCSRHQTHTGYGFGFYVFKDGIYGHGGGSPGMNGEMHILPKQVYVVVVLANRDPYMATDTERFIEAALPQS
jgi:CubicO group peptidase (beta-lactamase class C family)